jgi:hypothetical protein
MLVLIDGDIFRYRCGFAAEKNHYLVELKNPNDHVEYSSFDSKKTATEYGNRTTMGVLGASYKIWNRKDVQPLENALQIVKQSLTQTLDAIQSRYSHEELEFRVILSGKTNFRTAIAVTRPYKGNREDSAKPVYYEAIGEYLQSNWNAKYTTDIEADDAIGIAAMEAKEGKRSYVVVSNDKDLHQIPGLHYNWITKEFYEVSSKEAKTNLFIQILSGDATDNVPGLPGVGPATAAKLLAECKTPIDMVEACADAYKAQALLSSSREQTWAGYMFEQAQLVYILKHPNEYWDTTKEGTYFIEKYHNGLYKETKEKQIEISTATQRA